MYGQKDRLRNSFGNKAIKEGRPFEIVYLTVTVTVFAI